jgi:hypothetical protein
MKSQLKTLMNERLPSLSYQERLRYSTSPEETSYLFDLLNEEVFGNRLSTPKIEIIETPKDYFGECLAYNSVPEYKNQSNCYIKIAERWACRQWLITILAHEMCHQYQWDVVSLERMKAGMNPLMSHGPTFFAHRDALRRVDIPLMRLYSRERWLKYQRFI